MLINADAKALEWCVGSWLANDQIALNEIINGLDMHSDNQTKFGLPSRLISKKFLFRLIFGGSAYSYANDPDFTEASTNERYWQKAIDAFHEKYRGWSSWWTKLIKGVTSTGYYISPLGRKWEFSPKKNSRGESKWPITQIYNFQIQGTSADLMSLTRILFSKRFKQEEVKGVLISTVHDSIVVDVEEQETERVCKMFHEVFSSVPDEVFRRFGVKYELPFRCECSYGLNLKEMTEYAN